MVNTIIFRFELMKFRKDFSVCANLRRKFFLKKDMFKIIAALLVYWQISEDSLTRIKQAFLFLAYSNNMCQFGGIAMTSLNVSNIHPGKSFLNLSKSNRNQIYLPFSIDFDSNGGPFGFKSIVKMVNTIGFQVDLIRFRGRVKNEKVLTCCWSTLYRPLTLRL